MDEQAETISFDDFVKVKLRVGKIVEAAEHPNADRLLVLQVDLGDERRPLCAGIKGCYEPEDLVGTSIAVVTNLAPRMMRGVESQGMLLAATNPDVSGCALLTVREPIPPGTPIS